jgi:hypothetical protein
VCVCVNTVKGELKEWRTKPHREPVLAVEFSGSVLLEGGVLYCRVYIFEG